MTNRGTNWTNLMRAPEFKSPRYTENTQFLSIFACFYDYDTRRFGYNEKICLSFRVFVILGAESQIFV